MNRLAAALTATILVAGLVTLGALCIAAGVALAWALPPGWMLAGLWIAAGLALGALWVDVYRTSRERLRAGKL
jgi:hypothetical protein